jgi:hypothetical protein
MQVGLVGSALPDISYEVLKKGDLMPLSAVIPGEKQIVCTCCAA